MPLALVTLGGCEVENDTANDQVTVKYDEQRIEKAARDTGRTAKAVASGAAHVAADTADSVKREVGDIDVDVKIRRNRSNKESPPAE